MSKCVMPFCVNEADSKVTWEKYPDERGMGGGVRSVEVCASCWKPLLLFLAGETRRCVADA